MQDDFTLTPAQRRVLDALQATNAPIVVEDARRYTLDGEPVHWATVEALERRGILLRDDERLVLVKDSMTEADADPMTERPDDSMVVRPNDPKLARPDDGTVLADLLVKDELAANDAAIARARRTLDASRRARERLGLQAAPRRDESLFGRLWRRLEGLVG